jgi:hypothetical protein
MLISGRVMMANPTVKMINSLREVSEHERLSRAEEMRDGVVSTKEQPGQKKGMGQGTGTGQDLRHDY